MDATADSVREALPGCVDAGELRHHELLRMFENPQEARQVDGSADAGCLHAQRHGASEFYAVLVHHGAAAGVRTTVHRDTANGPVRACVIFLLLVVNFVR